MITGSCCCGAVKFELLEKPSMMGTCHCSRCRKVGASTIIFTNKDHFRLTQGEDMIQYYQPEDGYKYTRSFCSRCGTALGEIGSGSDSFPIPANTLDDAPGISVQFHEFTAEKPDWYQICDDAKQFEHHPFTK